MNKATFREILPPSFTKKACKFIIKRDSKNFLKVAKGMANSKTFQPNSVFQILATLMIESFLLKLKTRTPCFEHNVFHNNLKDNVYG